jgi:predicted site-specific integrase-resolvase
MTKPEPEWVKLKVLADREGVTVRTVHRWIDKGAVEASRYAPRTGVRVRAPGRTTDDNR